MDTTNIVIVSVLSTLGIVAVIAFVAVMFNKLSKKVDTRVIEQTHQRMDEINRRIDQTQDEFGRLMNANYDDLRRQTSDMVMELHRRIDENHSYIDSRCDKILASAGKVIKG